MGKRILYTKITPLPSHIPRQLALDMLHSHGEVISLNPLVTAHTPIPAPRDAASDEFFAQWYEILEIITWGFGMKKKISFKGCFHDLPNGLQTHTYAPMGVDLRNKWTVRGNQPGEAREPRELGVETPSEGLYLREDVEIVCNAMLSGFVKKEMKAAAGVMVERLTRKAELLDEGVLHAMFENGRLRTVNPHLQSQQQDRREQPQRQDTLTVNYREQDAKSPAPSSPGATSSTGSPPLHPSPGDYEDKKQFYGTYHNLTRNSHRSSYLPAYHPNPRHPSAPEKSSYYPPATEVEGSTPHPPQPHRSPQQTQQTFRAELPDTSVPPPSDARPAPLQPRRQSAVPSPQPSPRPSQTSPALRPAAPHRASASGYVPYNPSEHAPMGSDRGSSPAPPPPHQSPGQQFQSPPQGKYSPPQPRRASQQQTPGSGGYKLTNPDSPTSPSSASSPGGAGEGGGAGQRDSLTRQVQGLGISERQSFGGAQGGERIGGEGMGGEGQGGLSKCPVCGTFEGDELAVSHHVGGHFA